MSDSNTDTVERPDEWPEMYSAAGRSASCPHQMHWDNSDGVYRCIHDCGEVDETPPGIETSPEQGSENTVRVVVEYDRSESDGYDEVIPVEPETPFVWQEDPYYHSPSLDIGIHPDDRPAHLGIYTSESVRSPPGYDNHVESGYWDGPVERGLNYDEEDIPLFGCEVWGRIMFFVELPEEDDD